MLPALNRHNSPVNALALRQLRLSSTDRVLEVGFGGGALLSKVVLSVQQGHVAGVDYSIDAVDFCRRKLLKAVSSGLLELHCADVCQLPFSSDSFAKVCSVNTIYFWPDARAAFCELYRVLQKRGLFVLCFSPRKEMQSRKFTQHGFRLYEQDEVGDLLTTAGFQVLSVDSASHNSDHWLAFTAAKK
jgi:ubiquinone/menaquinone biosynthesis C-methylase UbiE